MGNVTWPRAVPDARYGFTVSGPANSKSNQLAATPRENACHISETETLRATLSAFVFLTMTDF